MMPKKFLSLASLQYELPQERIALYPAKPRHSSKLLLYQNNQITETVFEKLSEHIPENALLIFNDSKVIPARLVFHKESGAKIEIFCLEQHEQKNTNTVIWECFVGGVSKWKKNELFAVKNGIELRAKLLQKHADAYLVQFNWNADISFYDVLEIFGDVPLPPYLKRASEASDKQTYQTVYSQKKGSVAAPTAGLHFSAKVLADLAQKNIQIEYVTLHVGAGTFKPIKVENVYEHEMHHEWIDVPVETIKHLAENENRMMIPVGTTSLRTLETLYWLGVKLHTQGEENFKNEFLQFENLELEKNGKITAKIAFETLLHYCEKNKLERFIARTQIMITPDYKIQTANAILTNFHQPESSLLLLIAAFVGDEWKTIYNYALAHNFRFLSYGDSSLLWLRKEEK